MTDLLRECSYDYIFVIHVWWNEYLISSAHCGIMCPLVFGLNKAGHLPHPPLTCPAMIAVHYCAMPLQRGNFLSKYSRKARHSSPVRARYGVSFVGSAADWYSASISPVICTISCYIRPRYIGTRPYLYAYTRTSWVNIRLYLCT